MLLESEPTPLAAKCFGGFDGGSKANVGHYPLVVHPDGVEPLKNKMKSRAPRLLTPKMQK